MDGAGSYEEFFPYYVAMHSHRSTRVLHAVGTLGGLGVALSGVRRRRRRLLALPLLGYGFAWPSHWLVERNNPASFGHPAWSLRGDVRMITMLLRGRDAELQALSDGWWAAHPAGAPTRHPVTVTAP